MKSFRVKHGKGVYVVDAVSEVDAVLHVGYVCDMANLWKSETGLPFSVWVEEPSEGRPHPHNKRRVKYGNSKNNSECVSVSYWDSPTFDIRAGSVKNVKGMTDGDVTLLRKWLTLNLDLLNKLADAEITGTEFRNSMKRI